MAVTFQTGATPARRTRLQPAPSRRATSRSPAYKALASALAFTASFAIAEVAFRWLWNPKYWIHTNSLFVGSGATEAGKKWWPDTTYVVDSSEFRLEFRTNTLGYRARPDRVNADHPYRIAFVGDSFTEAMQVAYETTFCAQLERLLNEESATREIVCENYGVSATDLPDYWHRITHDVLTDQPPDALVLCIYPGNDFQCSFPDAAFDAADHLLRDYFTKPSAGQHLIAWVNLHLKFGSYVQRALLSIGSRAPGLSSQGPKRWWTDPTLARQAASAPAVRRSRMILAAVDEECRARGTKLCVLVVGPVANYVAKDGVSPIGRIIADWGLAVPVIDVAIQARAMPGYERFLFPVDGHLNEAGHALVAREAAHALADVLARDDQPPAHYRRAAENVEALRPAR
jgi:hypothetical protein